MSDSKNLKKIASLATIVLCLAFAAILAFTFAACDDIDALSATNPGDENMSPDDIIVENPNAVITKDFDENGVAECMYYFDYDGHCYNCNMGECEGHKYYLTKGGGAYSFYPELYTLTFEAEDGSTEINSEISVSLVFERPILGTDIYGNILYGTIYNENPTERTITSGSLKYLEVSSLTGEPLREKLDFNYEADWPLIKAERYVHYETYDTGFTYTEYHTEEPDWMRTVAIDPRLVYTDLTQTYTFNDLNAGYYKIYIYTTDGHTYTSDFWVGVAYRMLDAEVVYV